MLGSREITKRAFQLWADVIPLTFTEVCKTCKSDIRIDFARDVHSDHGDETSDVDFDGEGNTFGKWIKNEFVVKFNLI